MIVCIDPGKETGVAWIDEPSEILVQAPDKLYELTECKMVNKVSMPLGYCQIIEGDEHLSIKKLIRLLDNLFSVYEVTEFVIEDFIVGGTRSTKREVFVPIRVAAVVDYWIRERTDSDVVYQYNRDKGRIRDETLKAYGLFATPKTPWRHANDAMRHMVHRALSVYS